MLTNLTPHPITIRSPDGEEVTCPLSANGPARVTQRPSVVLPSWWTAHIKGPVLDGTGPCPVVQSGGWTALEGLPEEAEPGETIIVSLFAAQAAKNEAQGIREALHQGFWSDGTPVLIEDRDDMEKRVAVLGRLVCPGTGPDDEPIRNADGRVVAVTRLVRV